MKLERVAFIHSVLVANDEKTFVTLGSEGRRGASAITLEGADICIEWEGGERVYAPRSNVRWYRALAVQEKPAK